ncbi:4-coumarate-CoA ligase 1 [Culex quinquefasciatus]|uniref:4-coumarate-CoA ligase 1 n=1 Tax=Culex quinquefasciatus TaxID=7176 RepID=B0X7Q3_CULQU|nr:4-coumarate-CoA ligase 1 [Culex quinquefasciatus]|eukprot:XP_001865675.1 4-coumarate-CoA ligase 1 [Culex quinquefasciatus]
MAKYDPKAKLWRGPACPSVRNPEANLGQVVIDCLSQNPAKVIQINADDGGEMSCAEMKRRIARVVHHLRLLGLRKGDFVSLACGSSENVVPVFIGCLSLGVVVNPLAPVFSKDDYAHMMKMTQSKVVFCDVINREVVEQAVEEAIKVKPVMFVFGNAGGNCRSVEDLLSPVAGEDFFIPEYLGDSNQLMAMVLCSSGTTGLPKGVCLSHANLIEGDVFREAHNCGPIFNFSALFWATGMFAVLTSLYYTRTRVLTSKPFNEELLIDILTKYNIEDVFTPPAYVAVLQNYPNFNRLSFPSIKQWTMGGAMVTQQMSSNLSKKLPNGVAGPIYGTSEMGIISRIPFAPGSVGTLVRNIEVKIVDDDGHRLGPNQKGEIRLKHKHPMLGYLYNADATLAAFDEEDFFKSGDVGYFDSDGYLYVIDRIKDIIKFNNYQISPSDLETIIEKIDGVKLVCVVGVPLADKSGDLATAVIERNEGAKLTEQEVVGFVDGQVSDFKRLRGGVRFVDELPKSAAGKVLRRVVKEMVLKEEEKSDR